MKIAYSLMLVLFVTSAYTHAQEKKDKQEIKIVISDKDGKKVVIDTTFNTIAHLDSIKLKGGDVIYIHKDDGLTTAHMSTGDDGKVMIVKNISHSSADNDGEVMTWVSSEGDTGGKSVVFISKGEPGIKEGEIKYNIEVKTDESGNKEEKTSYIIARDGMVVTIEGGSEEKVKELASTIEKQLGVSKDEGGKKPTVKEEQKKTVKK